MYGLKPWSASVLVPVLEHLVRLGVAPSTVSAAGVAVAALGGLVLAVLPAGATSASLVLVAAILRLARRRVGTPFGHVVNELGDRGADMALLVGLAWHVHDQLAVGPLLASCAPSWAALAAVSAGDRRRNGGPVGKTERASAPLVSVGLAAVVLGERLTPARLIGSGIAVTGVALVCLSRSGLSVSGAVWVVVAAAVVQGVYHPLTRPLLRTNTSLEVVTYAMVAGTVSTAPLLLFDAGSLTSASAGAWTADIYLGLFPSALGLVLWAMWSPGSPSRVPPPFSILSRPSPCWSPSSGCVRSPSPASCWGERLSSSAWWSSAKGTV